ncbi:MAG: RpiB/LacA/LacB family sugar-phosphate isomerase [Dehalococcoidia bacterium]
MRFGVAADHAGFPLKAPAIAQLQELGHEALDLGGDGTPGDDYPDFSQAVGEAVSGGVVDRAVLICGSGVGASVAATKIPGVRAAICHDTWSARQGVEDDDMNVLCLGARAVGPELALELVRTFAGAAFSHAERHERRLGKVHAIEQHYSRPTEVHHG